MYIVYHNQLDIMIRQPVNYWQYNLEMFMKMLSIAVAELLWILVGK